MDLLPGLENDFNSGAVHATSESGNVTDITFVDDCIVEFVVAEVRTYTDKYGTNSEDDFSDREDEDITSIVDFRSGWPIRAHFRLDL